MLTNTIVVQIYKSNVVKCTFLGCVFYLELVQKTNYLKIHFYIGIHSSFHFKNQLTRYNNLKPSIHKGLQDMCINFVQHKLRNN